MVTLTPPVINAPTRSSTLSLVKYKLVDPSDKLSVDANANEASKSLSTLAFV